jgi:hypothetical protein
MAELRPCQDQPKRRDVVYNVPTQTVGAPGPHPRERDCCLVPASINSRGAWRCAPTGWIAIRRPCAQRTPIGNEISGSVAMPFWRWRDVVFNVPTYAGHAIGPGSAGPDRHTPLRPCPRTSLPGAGWLVLGASRHSNAKAGPGGRPMKSRAIIGHFEARR